MSTRTVDLSQIGILAEVIVRGGNAEQGDARDVLKRAYVRTDDLYPDVRGLSTIFRPHAGLDDLAHDNQLPNAQLSWSFIGELSRALGSVGYELRLYVTPAPELPDHHTLAVLRNGQVEQRLQDEAANALLRVMRVVENPYRRSR